MEHMGHLFLPKIRPFYRGGIQPLLAEEHHGAIYISVHLAAWFGVSSCWTSVATSTRAAWKFAVIWCRSKSSQCVGTIPYSLRFLRRFHEEVTSRITKSIDLWRSDGREDLFEYSSWNWAASEVGFFICDECFAGCLVFFLVYASFSGGSKSLGSPPFLKPWFTAIWRVQPSTLVDFCCFFLMTTASFRWPSTVEILEINCSGEAFTIPRDPWMEFLRIPRDRLPYVWRAL